MDIQSEIKQYDIMSFTTVRASGSTHGNHPRRCLWDICGKPSLQWVLEAVKDSGYINKMIVATEDDKIAEVAKGLGATIIHRPLWTSLDYPRDYSEGHFKRNKPRSLIHQKPTIYTDVKEYALYYLEKTENYVPDLILSADANRPLGTSETVKKVVESFFQDEEATGASTYFPLAPYIYIWNSRAKRVIPFYTTKFDRQEALRLYEIGPFGLAGIAEKSSSQGDKVAPVFISREEGLDMHNEEDLFYARCLMKKRLEKIENRKSAQDKNNTSNITDLQARKSPNLFVGMNCPWLYFSLRYNIIMRKTLKYRLFPTKKQKRVLQEHLNECRWLYNHFLEERKSAWEKEKKSINYFQQCNSIPILKKRHSSLNKVYSQVLQNVADRIDKAFQNFFRRVKQRQKPGYPRFKGLDRYDSFTYKQANFGWKIENNHLSLSKIGSIKIKLHRPVIGILKTCTIRKKAGKWYACISIEYEPKFLPKSKKAVGIDVGLENFATFSTGERIANPHFLKTEEKALAKAQRKLSKQPKDTPERQKAKKVVIRIHERISNRRHNFIHQETRKIINRLGIICIEKLNTKNMMQNHFLAKSIADVAWNQFAQVLASKAAEAGRKFIAIDPKNTSQICSQCGTIVKKKLSTRWHKCPICGLHLHRDINASRNILRLGLQSLDLNPRSSRL